MAVMLVAVVVGFGLFSSTQTANANHGAFPDEMTIFHTAGGGPCAPSAAGGVCPPLDPGPAGGGTFLNVPVGGSFEVVASVTTQAAAYDGYQVEIAWLDAIVDFVSETPLDTSLELCAPAGVVVLAPLEIAGLGSGCLSSNGAEMFVNPVHEFTLTCASAGTTSVAMVDKTEDPTFGTEMIAPGGVSVPTDLENQFGPTGFPAPQDFVAAILVNCLDPVDLDIQKAGPATAAVGDAGQYTITVSHDGAAALDVDIDDAAPAGVTFTAVDNGPACSIVANSVDCNALSVPTGAPVVITVDATFDTCGIKDNTASGQFSAGQPVIDANQANNSSTAQTDVDCAVLTVTKTGPAVATDGDVINYNVQICNDGGGTAASNVVVSDVPGPAPVPAAYASIASGACENSTVTVAVSTGVVCNTASATQDAATGGPSNDSEACTTVNPSANGMLKDLSADPGFQSTSNLWICKGAGFNADDITGVPAGDLPADQPECNTLTFNELLFLSADGDTCNDDDDGDGAPCAGENTGGDPNTCDLLDTTENYIPGQTDIDCDGGEVGEGLGAIEFQLKYDHKMFQEPVIDCDTALLNAPGRHVEQVVSVVTENWSLVGCVTKDDTPGAPVPPGVLAPAGTVATVTLTIQPDLFQRLRPTKDNGVIVDLLDENCEAADIFGMPWNDNDTTQGGLLKDCGDATITIRMLEGDVDLDCQVTLADDQAVAYRYGSFFGNLLYNKFFDLEPNIAPDFDIDIKDLQTVFGRNGSTCANPIPDQVPGSQVPDP